MNKQIVKRLIAGMNNCTIDPIIITNETGSIIEILTVEQYKNQTAMPRAIMRSGTRPPFVGWWRTTDQHYASSEDWRFWNGDFYSYRERSYDNAFGGRGSKPYITLELDRVSWSWEWPDNCRVPRIEPLAFEQIKQSIPMFEDWTINQFLERIAK